MPLFDDRGTAFEHAHPIVKALFVAWLYFWAFGWIIVAIVLAVAALIALD